MSAHTLKTGVFSDIVLSENGMYSIDIFAHLVHKWKSGTS